MRVVVGRVGRAHGIKGDLTVEVRTDEPERRFAVGAIVHSGDRDLTITAARQHAGRLLVRLDGVDDRTAAEDLRGTMLEVEIADDERPDEPEDYYDHHLIDLGVRRASAQGTSDVIGRVQDVLHLPEQDLLVVALDTGREVLVPFVHELVPVVDLDAGDVTVADVPGLLDPDAADVAATQQSGDQA